MLSILLNIGLFLLGGVIGGFFVGRKMTEDIEEIMEDQDDLILELREANNHLINLGVKDGQG
tara:strand:- start:156 stop:341 length:186 start_codon:yes stop_codon:yes gene_type:complete